MLFGRSRAIRVLVKSPTAAQFSSGPDPSFGPASGSDYTVEADVRAVEKRRQMGDAGVVAQRYELVLWAMFSESNFDPGRSRRSGR